MTLNIPIIRINTFILEREKYGVLQRIVRMIAKAVVWDQNYHEIRDSATSSDLQ